MRNRRYGIPRTDEERLKEHFGSDWRNHSISELPERGSRLGQRTVIKGPLGFWKFPFLNKFMGPELSIKDHKVISGKPDYIGEHQILVDGQSVPFEIEFAYDTTLKSKRYDNRTGALVAESPDTKKVKGERFLVPQAITEYLRQTDQHFIFEQVEPR